MGPLVVFRVHFGALRESLEGGLGCFLRGEAVEVLESTDKRNLFFFYDFEVARPC